MNTIFESQLELFSSRSRVDVVDWIALDSRWDITGFFVKDYEIETKTKQLQRTGMKLQIHRTTPNRASVELWSVVYINDNNNSTSISDPDLELIEDSIAWNEWLNLPPDLVEDIMKEAAAWFERAKTKVGFFS